MSGTTRHLVHPELQNLLDVMPSRHYTDESLPAARAQLKTLEESLPPPGEDGMVMETRHVPGPQGAPDVRILIFRPEKADGPLPAMFHMHGGGYINGTPELIAPVSRALARELNCVIVSVAYRRGPETSFPGNIEDCYAALSWTFDHAAELGIDPERIGVGGESAGGGLAASLALLARDRGRYRVAFQNLIYPMIDDRTQAGADLNPNVGEFIWDLHNNHYGWRALLGSEPGGDDVSPYAAAARAENLEGLPPAFIGVGALDLFLEEDMDYARRLLRAGVEVELHVYPAAFHGFDQAFDSSPAMAMARDRLDWLRRMMAKRPA